VTHSEAKDEVTGAGPFLSQLRPGERVLWNAPESAAVRDAEYGRSQRYALSTSVLSTVAGCFMVWKVYESVAGLLTRPSTSSNSDAFGWALFAAVGGALIWGAFAVVTLRISVASTRSYFMGRAIRRADRLWHYVLTDQRIFCVDESGDLIDAIEGQEIVAVDLADDRRPSALLIERRNPVDEDTHLILGNLEQPHVAKAKIAETFLEPAP
jgi:hypothetical protein